MKQINFLVIVLLAGCLVIAYAPPAFSARVGVFTFDVATGGMSAPASTLPSPEGEGITVQVGELPVEGGEETLVTVRTSDGEEVAKLHQGPAATTEGKTFVWDGKSDDGTLAPSGIYILEVTAPGFYYSEKIIHTPASPAPKKAGAKKASPEIKASPPSSLKHR